MIGVVAQGLAEEFFRSLFFVLYGVDFGKIAVAEGHRQPGTEIAMLRVQVPVVNQIDAVCITMQVLIELRPQFVAECHDRIG